MSSLIVILCTSLGAVAFQYILTLITRRRQSKNPEALSEDICKHPEKYDNDFVFLKSLDKTSIVRLVFKYWLELTMTNEEPDAQFQSKNDGSGCVLIINAKYYVFDEGNPQRMLLCDSLIIPAEHKQLVDEITKLDDTLSAGIEYQRDDKSDGSVIISIWQNLAINYSAHRPQDTITAAIDNAHQLQLDLIRRYNRLRLQAQ